MTEMIRIERRSGTAFKLQRGQRLTVCDPVGEQVSDMVAFGAPDLDEALSNGRTFDYQDTIYLTAGHKLYSNRSNVMLHIERDDVGRHDFLLTPCSTDTFRILYDDADPHRGCFGNLAAALEPFGIAPDHIPCAFNIFMNVPVNGDTGRFSVQPPLSTAGDVIVFRAEMDLIIGLTACSAPSSNNGTMTPIDYRID